MKIIKFGGNCLESSNDFKKISEILKTDPMGGKVVVLSALFGITDILITGLNLKKLTENDINTIVFKVKTVHYNIINEFFDSRKEKDNVIKIFKPYLSKLKKLFLAMLYTGELSESLESSIQSFGERLSVVLFSLIMNREGLKTIPYFSDEIGIVNKGKEHLNCADLNQTKLNLIKAIPKISKGVIPVITGYFAIDYNKRISTFGRNGSDYSASVIAYGFNAEVLEFWKNVPGFMSSDPVIVKNSKLIKELSIDEAAELSYFGSSILHPRCLEPIRDTKTKIVIRNFADPEKESTTIKSRSSNGSEIVGVTFNEHISVLKINGAGVGYKPGIIGNVGTILSSNNINIYSIITTQTSINLIIDQKDLQRSNTILRSLKDPIIESIKNERDLTLIAIVGKDITRNNRSVKKLFFTLDKLGVNIEMISAGASDSAYYFLIKKDQFERSINKIHDELIFDSH